MEGVPTTRRRDGPYGREVLVSTRSIRERLFCLFGCTVLSFLFILFMKIDSCLLIPVHDHAASAGLNSALVSGSHRLKWSSCVFTFKIARLLVDTKIGTTCLFSYHWPSRLVLLESWSPRRIPLSHHWFWQVVIFKGELFLPNYSTVHQLVNLNSGFYRDGTYSPNSFTCILYAVRTMNYFGFLKRIAISSVRVRSLCLAASKSATLSEPEYTCFQNCCICLSTGSSLTVCVFFWGYRWLAYHQPCK